MAKRHVWTRRQERYLESLKRQWDRNVPTGKRRYDAKDCPIDHPHAYKRGYCLISERQWIVWLAKDFEPALDQLTERAIWTKYGRVNGLRENGKVKRDKPVTIRDSYKSPNSRVSLVSNFGTRDSIDDWHKWLVASGCPYLGGGVSRDVYDLGDGYVIKIAKQVAFTDYNTDEIELYKRAREDGNADYFAPIIAADSSGRWLVMQKADTSGERDIALGRQIVDDLHAVISEYALYDIHIGNVGTIDGNPVLIDYAR